MYKEVAMTDDRLPDLPPENTQDRAGIDPDEVDLVVNGLRRLIRQVSSPTLQDLLEETRHDIAGLIAEDQAVDFDEDDFAAAFELDDDDDCDGEYRRAA
jgi:hypothetical protein